MQLLSIFESFWTFFLIASAGSWFVLGEVMQPYIFHASSSGSSLERLPDSDFSILMHALAWCHQPCFSLLCNIHVTSKCFVDLSQKKSAATCSGDSRDAAPRSWCDETIAGRPWPSRMNFSYGLCSSFKRWFCGLCNRYIIYNSKYSQEKTIKHLPQGISTCFFFLII